MDRVEALREWCVERVLESIRDDKNCKPRVGLDRMTEDIIPMAEALEAYINGYRSSR